MKFLLLQARNPGDEAAPHEQVSFRDVLGIRDEELTPWDLLSGTPPADVVDAHGCVLVGGSGEYGVNDAGTHPWLKAFIDFCGTLADRGMRCIVREERGAGEKAACGQLATSVANQRAAAAAPSAG